MTQTTQMHNGFKETEIGDLPTEWEVLPIGEIAKTASGGTPDRKRPDFFEGAIPWVKSGELGDGWVKTTTESITQEAVRKSSAKLFPKGTLLVALYGATAGKVGILEIDAATNQAVCAVFPNQNADSRFLFYAFMYHRQDLLSELSIAHFPQVGSVAKNLILSLQRLARIYSGDFRKLHPLHPRQAHQFNSRWPSR